MGRRRKDEAVTPTEEPISKEEPVQATQEIVFDDAPVSGTVSVPASDPLEDEGMPRMVHNDPDYEPAESEPVPAPDTTLDQALVKIFKNTPRTNVPTLINYKPTGSSTIKHVIVDINLASIEEGWRTFKAKVPNGSSEAYLLKVYEITRSEIPRMYRAVAVTTLN